VHPRIASITTYSVSYPLEAPMADALHYIPGRAALLVEVASDDGKLGVGESAIYGGSASVTEALNAGSRCADRRLRTHGVGPCQGARKDRPVSGPVADG
jgi:L-alanine-DL-glutamate epimerase-like enolase superfamily enzyme